MAAMPHLSPDMALAALDTYRDIYPASTSFGVTARGEFLDQASYYRVPASPTPLDRLCFDVSNNRIACSINQRGIIERFAIQSGLVPVETAATPVGAYVEKVLDRAGPLPLLIGIGKARPVPLEDLPQPAISLADNLFPCFTWDLDSQILEMLVFAPCTSQAAPRALCMHFTNRAKTEPAAQSVAIQLGDLEGLTDLAGGVAARTQLLLDRGAAWQSLSQTIVLAVNESATAAILFVADAQELAQTQAALENQPGPAWLSATQRYHRTRYGQLNIPEAPFYADLYTRAAELCRQSLLLGGTGEFGGSFNGSDLPAANNVWMRDCFYSSLPQSFLSPELCAKAILFFLQWSVPEHTLGEHATKFPGALGVTNSLGNSVAGIVLAGFYHENTADGGFFHAHPEVLTRSLEILDQVLASRREETFLFPSIYVSDGESRGDFHTGSNIFLWRAFTTIAELADKVYSRPGLAQVWQGNAQKLRTAILDNCVVGSRRFVEGVMQDHTTIDCHDGEESDVTLAPFYGFCEVDDEAYLNAARAAISPSNPYAIQELEGIWWFAHGKWSSATFPGWITALASSSSEAEALRHLERIRTFTDADGSFWWWPYRHDAVLHKESPLRMNSKCGWAAGVYLCYFTRHLLGLCVDATKRKIEFRPFLPWHEFTWKNCRIGAVEFDCSYVRRNEEIEMSIRNLVDYPVEVTLQVVLPERSKLLERIPERIDMSRTRQFVRYGRIAVENSAGVAPGEVFTVSVKFSPGSY
jgi:hypothetical protein